MMFDMAIQLEYILPSMTLQPLDMMLMLTTMMVYDCVNSEDEGIIDDSP